MVGELSNRNVVVGQRSESVIDLARRMRDEHVGAVIIIDNPESRRPVGILTDRDIVVVAVAEQAARLDELIADDVMTRTPVTAREEERVEDVVVRMRDRGVRRIPVIDRNSRLTGILTYDDIVGHMSDELRSLTRLVAREQQHERVRLVDDGAGRGSWRSGRARPIRSGYDAPGGIDETGRERAGPAVVQGRHHLRAARQGLL